MTGLLASIVEAYGELRVNKGRILLSLLGVAFSVFALTVVMGGGGMLKGALEQSTERWAGRDATLTIHPMGGADATTAELDQAVLDQVDRLGITHRTRVIHDTQRVQTPAGVVGAGVLAVDPDYATIYRTEVGQGRWLTDADSQRLAPVLVVNTPLYEALGRPELGTEPVTVYGVTGAADADQAYVIGVLAPDPQRDYGFQAITTVEALAALPGRDTPPMTSEYVVWVPPELGDALYMQLSDALRSTSAGGYSVNPPSMTMDDMGFDLIAYAVIGVAMVILLLGAMGLVNISLVTVRYRVREIGIRRSYGATGGRVFVGVLMESVVATVVAGAVGVTAAVALVKAPFVTDYFRTQGLVDLPAFPVGAVLLGLGAATAVGVLAGALPALIATRIRVIDAIRS